MKIFTNVGKKNREEIGKFLFEEGNKFEVLAKIFTLVIMISVKLYTGSLVFIFSFPLNNGFFKFRFEFFISVSSTRSSRGRVFDKPDSR